MPPPRPRTLRPLGGLVVARPLGIELVVHPTWLVTFALLGLLARRELAPDLAPGAGDAALWGLAVAMTLGFALSVVLHEMAHAVVARAYGLEARRITLFLFGGVAAIGKQAPAPGAEFRIALAGPLLSLIIASALAVVSRLLHPVSEGAGIEGVLPGIWGFFAGVNLIVALFNLVPGFPLDGGRILRSVLWRLIGDRARATRWAAVGGRGVAVVLMVAGLVAATFDGGADGVLAGFWYVMLGWFLFGAVGAAARAEGGAAPGDPAPPELAGARSRAGRADR